jgi:hypothetical protein
MPISPANSHMSLSIPMVLSMIGSMRRSNTGNTLVAVARCSDCFLLAKKAASCLNHRRNARLNQHPQKMSERKNRERGGGGGPNLVLGRLLVSADFCSHFKLFLQRRKGMRRLNKILTIRTMKRQDLGGEITAARASWSWRRGTGLRRRSS